MDVDRAPLYNQALPSPLDPEDLDFVNLKAPLVLYMLDKRMCKGGSAFGLSRVISNILLSAMSGELAQNLISLHGLTGGSHESYIRGLLEVVRYKQEAILYNMAL